MRYNGTTVPTGRDITYDVSEIHRKSADEKMDSAFNDDQKAIIEDVVSDIAGLTASVQGLEEAIDDIDGGGGSPLIIEALTYATPSDTFPETLDATGEEVYAAYLNGQNVLIHTVFEIGDIDGITSQSDEYSLVDTVLKYEDYSGEAVETLYFIQAMIGSSRIRYRSDSTDPNFYVF